jgi:phage I-like protein
MAVTLYKKGLSHAHSLVSAGKVNKSASWSFSAEDGNAMLGQGGDDWTKYGSFHLGEDTSAGENTKERFNYPFGKGGEVYRSALEAIRQRAGQEKETAIFDAAGKLLETIDGADKKTAKDLGIGSAECFILGNVPDLLNGQVPREIDVLAEGTYKGYVQPGVEGPELAPFTVTGSHIDAAIAHFNERKLLNPQRDLVIDYEHQTWKGAGAAPAAGWMDALYAVVRDGKKVMRANVREWTDKAAEYIKNKEYRYISPVFALNALDKKSGKVLPCIFFNAALTNEPLFDELQPIISSLNFNPSTRKDTHMEELLERLRYFLGMPITATAPEIVAELNKLIGQISSAMGSAETSVTAKTLLAELKGWKDAITAKTEVFKIIGAATLEEAKAKLASATTSVATVADLQAKLNVIETENLEERFGLVIAKGVETGRILPAQRDNKEWLESQKVWAKTNFATFKDWFTAKAPVVGPISVPVVASGAQGSGITDVDRQIMNTLGVKEEQFKKYNTVN